MTLYSGAGDGGTGGAATRLENGGAPAGAGPRALGSAR